MKSTMKTAVKSLLATVEAKETEALPKKLSAATAVLAKAASKGLIHKKTASRRISRLAKRVNTVQAKG